jgi:hypothetical protein
MEHTGRTSGTRVDVPTLLLVWPDDTPEHPHYAQTPLANCKPDPLTWLHVLCASTSMGHGPAFRETDQAPDTALVVLPSRKVDNRPEDLPLPILEPVPDPG